MKKVALKGVRTEEQKTFLSLCQEQQSHITKFIRESGINFLTQSLSRDDIKSRLEGILEMNQHHLSFEHEAFIEKLCAAGFLSPGTRKKIVYSSFNVVTSEKPGVRYELLPSNPVCDLDKEAFEKRQLENMSSEASAPTQEGRERHGLFRPPSDDEGASHDAHNAQRPKST